MSRGLIRSEAQPTSWNRLSSSQKKVVTQVLTIIAEAIELVSEEKKDEDNQKGPFLSNSRASRIAFLDGERGTGKSTVLVTLLNVFKTGELPDTPDNLTIKAMAKVAKRVVVLEPIDMEPVPQHWNMFPAILARVGEAYSRYSTTSEQNSSGLLNPSNHYHEAWKELQKLQNNVALSWDGNLDDRAGYMDSDTNTATCHSLSY